MKKFLVGAALAAAGVVGAIVVYDAIGTERDQRIVRQFRSRPRASWPLPAPGLRARRQRRRRRTGTIVQDS